MDHRIVYIGNQRCALYSGANRCTLPPYDARVEFLEANGTQYIDTGYIIKSSSIIDITFDNVDIGFVLGARQSDKYQYSAITNQLSGSFNIRMGNKIVYTIDTRPIGTLNVHLENRNIIINNSVVSSTAWGTDYYNGNCFAFLINQNGTPSVGSGDGTPIRIRSLKFDNKINFIPVRVGNVGYLFDTISGKLFANAGTGKFILGPDITD